MAFQQIKDVFFDPYLLAVATGAVTTALAVLLSGALISKHLRSWTDPRQQKLIIYIIIMVPLFAVDSFIGLLEIEASATVALILDSIKECYEAFVIMSFLDLMYALLDVDPQREVPRSLAGRHIHLIFPFNLCFKEMTLNQKTLNTIRSWTTQFVILRPILSIITVVLQLMNKLDSAYMLISIILNISVTVAVSALMIFYHTFVKELSPYRPLAKFLCIKGVVFFAFWQSVVLEVLCYFKVVHEGHWYTTEEVSETIQNLLVCIEMGLLFTFAHNYAFDSKFYDGKKRDSVSSSSGTASPGGRTGKKLH